MNGTNDFLIMRPFNALFFTIFAALLLLLIIVSLALRGKSEELKKKIIVTVSLLTLAGFAVYKYFLSIDADYDILMQSQGGFDWWCELPLQLCNINMILIPIAVLLDKKELVKYLGFFLSRFNLNNIHVLFYVLNYNLTIGYDKRGVFITSFL